MILAQTGCYCKFNIEAQPCFRLFLPAASAAGRKFKPPASPVVVDYRFERVFVLPGWVYPYRQAAA